MRTLFRFNRPTSVVVSTFVASCLVAGLASGLASCGGGGTDRTKAQLRLLNASSGYAELDLLVADTRRQSAVAYGATAAYVEVAPGDASNTAISRAGSATSLLTLSPSLNKNSSYTLLAYGRAGVLKSLLIDDNSSAPASGRSTLRLLNAAPDAGTLDVYITGADEPLASAVPVQSGVEAGVLGPLLSVSSANWRLRVTAAGNKSDLRLDLPALALASQQVATLVLTPGAGGVLVNALLSVQQSAITRLDNTQARVRVVAGVADSAAISASVGGVAVAANVGSPAAGAYTAVAAGSPNLTVLVNGQPFQTSNPTLLAGADYSLLVYGPAASPRVSWLSDDNRPPANSSTAQVRLVHGVTGLTGNLSMTVDFLPLADGVAPGAASAYGATAASTTARLAVTAAGLAAPLFSAIDQRLDANATYSVFVVGAVAAPTGILRKDR